MPHHALNPSTNRAPRHHRLDEELKAAAARRAEEAVQRSQVAFHSAGLQAPTAPTHGGLSAGGAGGGGGAGTSRAPIGIGAAAAAAAKGGSGAPPRAPLSSSDPRLIQAQALAQALAAKGAAAAAAKRSKWDA